MARPLAYIKQTLFLVWANIHPENKVDPTSLDTEFNNIQSAIGQTQAVLNGITRADGKLAQVVTPESFDNAALALLRSGSFKPRGAWTAATLFNEGDIASINGASYACLIQHVSTTSFDFDANLGYWQMVANNALTGFPNTADVYSGNATQTDFPLSYTFSTPYAFLAFVDGKVKIPGIDFSLISGGSVIHFFGAPGIGSNNVLIIANTASAAAGAAAASATAADGSAQSAIAAASAAAASAAAAAASVGLSPGSNNAWTGSNSFSVSPTVPTVAPGDSSTKIASTEFVAAAVSGFIKLSGNNTWTGSNTFNGYVGIGANPTGPELLVVRKDQNAITYGRVVNVNTGASAQARFDLATGSPNSYILNYLADNAGSPYGGIGFGDGVNFYTWQFGGTERFRFGNSGQLGVGGANYGTSGQVLISGGPAAAPAWATLSLGTGSQVFTSSGTFTVPAGVTSVKVTVIGGGGGAGNSVASGNGNSVGSPGGCGGVAIKRITGLTPGATVAVTIGGGGAGGTLSYSAIAGGAGGTSSFGAYCSASGGGGGAGNVDSAPTSWPSNGSGSSGDINLTGRPTGTATANAGGDTPLGFGYGPKAAYIQIGNVNGSPGIGYGSGGAGGSTSAYQASGGAGAAGLVIVEW